MTEQRNKMAKIIYIISGLLVVFGFLNSIIFLREFYIVIIKNQIKDYPWGLINENPWYYENPNKYGIFCFVFGLLYLLSSVMTSWSIRKNKIRATVIGSISIVIVYLLEIINANN
jgi:hypothetical protein